MALELFPVMQKHDKKACATVLLVKKRSSVNNGMQKVTVTQWNNGKSHAAHRSVCCPTPSLSIDVLEAYPSIRAITIPDLL
jgi:hypothetical protein